MLGKRLGGYRIESELGAGGMGTVWLAVDADDRRYALKVIHSHLLESPGFFKRFLREAEIGKAVRHPNVVQCYDADALLVSGKQLNFLVMEYVEGQTLRELLEDLDRVPEELCRHVGREVAKGLAAIHEVGVVHRDLKPENVLITPEHEVKIMDLGVARVADEAIRLSQTGAFVGSIYYAAPEQFREGGEEIDGRADLHALGLILYELSSGTHPYRADDVHQVLRRVLHEHPRRLGELNPQLSAFFEEVAHTLIAKEREDRFGSAADLLRVLEAGEESTWWKGRAQTLRAETKRPLRRIRIPRETAVYGRDDELATLRELYGRAKEGDGRVVLIEGEAGIGKTRLVDELVGRLQQEGESLSFLFGSYPPGGAATAAGAWSTAYREQFGSEGLEETLLAYLTITPVLVPAFAALLRGEPPPPGHEPLTRDSIQTVFVHATRALAAERTTIVLIEDLHFAPEEGRAMFASLALAVPDHRILLVGTTRPGMPESWRANLDRMEAASRIELPRLGPKDLGRLLIDAFHSERLAEELALKIATKSDGNPFFVFEIIRGLREGQFITEGPDGTWMSTQVIEGIRIPSSVQDLIQARISDLDEESQELLDVAACCGYEFDPGLVAEAIGSARIPVLRCFGQMEKTHRVVRSSGRNLVFDHHQMQEALYAGIPAQLREEYHAALGRALLARDREAVEASAVEQCVHLFRGRRPDEALPRFWPALEYLDETHLHGQAIDLADLALRVATTLDDAERARILLAKSDHLHALGLRAPERKTLEEARELAVASGERTLEVRAIHDLGRHCQAIGDSAEAKDWFSNTIQVARDLGDPETEASALMGLAMAARGLGRTEEAVEHLTVAIERSESAGDERTRAGSLVRLGQTLAALGRSEEGAERLREGLDLARETGDLAAQVAALAAIIDLPSFEEGRDNCAEAVAIARQIGNRWLEIYALGNLAVLQRELGELEEARKNHEKRIAVADEIDSPSNGANAAANLCILAAFEGDQEGALHWGRRQLDWARRSESPSDRATATANLAITLWEGVRLSEALEHARAAVDLAEETEEVVCIAHAVGTLAQVLATLGALDEAGEALRRSPPNADWPRIALWNGIISSWMSRPDRAAECFEDALDSADERHKDTARIRIQWARLLLETGRPEEAAGKLEGVIPAPPAPVLPELAALSAAYRARLPDADVPALESEFEALGERVWPIVRLEAHHSFWKATRSPVHLDRAHEILQVAVENAPQEYRESMIANVPLHREIAAAWAERDG